MSGNEFHLGSLGFYSQEDLAYFLDVSRSNLPHDFWRKDDRIDDDARWRALPTASSGKSLRFKNRLAPKIFTAWPKPTMASLLSAVGVMTAAMIGIFCLSISLRTSSMRS